MAKDKHSVEIEEQRRYEELQHARAQGDAKNAADAQRRYDEFLRKHQTDRW